ncbi:MAG: hypothetical protein ACK4V2_04480 [Pseudomonadota bacterium]
MKKTLQFAFLTLFGLNGLYAFNPFTAARNVASGERLCQPKLVDEIKVGLPEYEKSHGGSNGHVIHSNKKSLKRSQDLEKKMQLLVKCTGSSVSQAQVEKLAKNHAKMAQEMAKICYNDPQFGQRFNTQCQIAVQADNYLKKKSAKKKSKGSMFSRMTGKKKSPSYYQSAPSNNGYGGNYNPMYGGQQPQFGGQPQQFGYNPQQQFGGQAPYGQPQFGQQPQFGGYNPHQSMYGAPMTQPYYGNPQALPYAQASYAPAQMAYAQPIPSAPALPVATPVAGQPAANGQIIGHNASQGIVCACP